MLVIYGLLIVLMVSRCMMNIENSFEKPLRSLESSFWMFLRSIENFFERYWKCASGKHCRFCGKYWECFYYRFFFWQLLQNLTTKLLLFRLHLGCTWSAFRKHEECLCDEDKIFLDNASGNFQECFSGALKVVLW